MTHKSEEKDDKKSYILIRILGFVKPFFGLLGLSFLLNIIFSALNAFSIALVKPVFQILFGTENPKAAEASSAVAPVPENFLAGLKEQFYDAIYALILVDGDMTMTLLRFSILIVLVFIFKNLFKYSAISASAKLEEGVIKSIRDKIFKHLTNLSVDFFSGVKQGTLISIITNDVTTVNRTTILSITKIIRESTQVFIFLFILLGTSIQLTLIAFSTTIVSLLIIKYASKYLRKYASRMQTAMADYTSTMQETIGGIRVVKAYNAMDIENDRFDKNSSKYLRSAIKHKQVIAMIPSINEVLAMIALCVVLFVGGSWVVNGNLKPDDLMLFLFTLFAIMAPIRNVINNVSKFQHGFVSAERIFSILDEKPSVRTGTKNIDKFEKDITVEDVTFAYENSDVISDVNLKIRKNRRIAFVGPSGSGKSTMLDLIIRFHDPDSGEIKIDGKDIKDLNIMDYRRLFGIVSQETILFNGTVANNIRYGESDATEEEVIEAAKKANAYDFIMNMPNGFDSEIGDRGVTLSGGERQRIAIARALLRDPYILVFDEATSALDAESEQVVQDAIDNSLKDKTALIVAHRLATIINSDEILVFDRGKVIEKGTHAELIKMNGLYKKLYDIQFAEK